MLPGFGSLDERFVHNPDGTVSDQATGLMWAEQDNGHDLSWGEAVIYCRTYQSGQYLDWRLPHPEELRTLKGAVDHADWGTSTSKARGILNSIISSPYSYWTSKLDDFKTYNVFSFAGCDTRTSPPSHKLDCRVLPVRGASALVVQDDGTIVTYSNGTVLHRQSRLMWQNKTSYISVNWKYANLYRKHMRGKNIEPLLTHNSKSFLDMIMNHPKNDHYSDWRIPTKKEMKILYRHPRSFIRSYESVWCYDASGYPAAFNLKSGRTTHRDLSRSSNMCVILVRDNK
ncbi:MAG TPA: DUF1566 domain-containing protein [Deltaproteobacteria bacterium]|nr:DUF1566 domain-containing protein [Deltaproteobacteria bacterium]HOI05797.1 DUF1566 domain-containing protein [Deltaproteobacteria bacterium]